MSLRSLISNICNYGRSVTATAEIIFTGSKSNPVNLIKLSWADSFFSNVREEDNATGYHNLFNLSGFLDF